MLLIDDAATRLARYGQFHGLAQAEAAAAHELDRALAALEDLVESYDGWEILELLRLRASPIAATPDEPEPVAAVVDLVALIIACRELREPASIPGAAGSTATPVIDKVYQAARTCFAAGSDLVFFRVAAAADPLAMIRASAVLREATLRNVIYPHMLEDTLRTLFDDPAVEADCRHALGFTGADAISVLTACSELRDLAWRERMAEAAVPLRRLRFIHGASSAGTDLENGTESVGQALDQAYADAAAALTSVWAAPPAAAAVTIEKLAAYTELSETVVSAVVDAFTLPRPQESAREVAQAFLTGTSPLRMAPLLRDSKGQVLLVHDVLALPAIRETLEQRLKDARHWDGYSKHRGAYLEQAAAELLERHLPGAQVYEGFEYFVPDPAAAVPQAGPARYTKRVEGDVLLVIDDIALIVEAKAVALTPASRAGDSTRLRRDLSRIVTEAAAQAQRLRERIDSDHGLRLRDGTWIDLGHIREVHTIAVSLEDLSGIATTTSQLVTAGLLPETNLPWTVSLHDLRVISELIDRPAELLVYLRRRTDADTVRKFRAVDELDLFLRFFEGGLYAEPDPEQVVRNLPETASPTVADRRRHRNDAQRVEIITSRTDTLDAWYFHRLGQTGIPAPKPAMLADPGLLALLDRLSELREPGWLSISAIMLEGSAATQRQYAMTARRLCERTAHDGHEHTQLLAGGTSRINSHVLIWLTVPRDGDRAAALEHLGQYLRAKKHQLQATRGAGMLIDACTGEVTDFLFDNALHGPDPALDRIVAAMALTPASAMPRTAPPPRARPRKR